MLFASNKRKCANVIYFIFITNVISQLTFDGVNYFYDDFNENIADLPELTCLDTGEMFDVTPMDGMNNYMAQTTESNHIIYYRVNITSEMKAIYGSLSVSTCCDQLFCTSYTLGDENISLSLCNSVFLSIPAIFARFWDGNGSILENEDITNPFCDSSSLDTYLYVLQEKKGQTILITSNDDDSACSNTRKSQTDLLEYPAGEYIIGVSGYHNEYGSFYLQLQCIRYSFPITNEQFDPPSDPSDIISITCESNGFHGTVNETQPVSYYLLNITESIYLPADVSTSSENVIFYIIKEAQAENYGYQYEIVDTNDWNESYTMTDDVYTPGVYWIVLQGWFHAVSQYVLTVECAPAPTFNPTIEPTIGPTTFPSTDPTMNPTLQPSLAPTKAPPKISRQLMTGIVFGVAGIVLLSLITYYLYECIKYHKNKHQNVQESGNKANYEPVLQLTTKQNDDEEEMEEDINAIGVMVAGTSIIRRLDSEKGLREQMSKDEDVIQAVLSHAISCTKDEEGFDMFQVLAIRYYEEKSRNVRPIKPLSRFGINFELIRLSAYVETLFVSVIIGLTQTWGTSVVVYKLIDAYFEGGNYELVCDMQQARWKDVFSLKVLSFLLSLVVTFFIGVLLKGIKHNGLYEIMERLELKHIKRVNHISLYILQMGQAINYYVCLVAILGSYFIIFSANQGEENDDDGSIDYSQSGLDMILNAVALFFMLELDDVLVTDDDYSDCGKHLTWILENYTPNITMNENYPVSNQVEVSVKPEDETDEVLSHCAVYMIPFMYYFINLFSVFVTICCYGGGFIAPFVIFFCW